MFRVAIAVIVVALIGLFALPLVAQNGGTPAGQCRLWFENWPRDKELPRVECTAAEQLRTMFPDAVVIYAQDGTTNLFDWPGLGFDTNYLRDLQRQLDQLSVEFDRAFRSVKREVAVPGTRWGTRASTGGFRITPRSQPSTPILPSNPLPNPLPNSPPNALPDQPQNTPRPFVDPPPAPEDLPQLVPSQPHR
jgi:hypothetical protein